MIDDNFGCFEDDSPDERHNAETILEKIITLSAVSPHSLLKQNILARLNFEGEELDLDDLPATDKYANYLSWLKVVKPLIPKNPVETLLIQDIQRNERIVQMLVISKVDVPEEIHTDYTESFFILEGRCVCTIGGQMFELTAGDYLDIPPHIPHDVRLLTSQVTAIIQHQF